MPETGIEMWFQHYKQLKAKWRGTIDHASQNLIKDYANLKIYQQHFESFESGEWGELSDIDGLKEKLAADNKRKIESLHPELDKLAGDLRELVKEFREISIDEPGWSLSPNDLKFKFNVLVGCYEKEFRFRERLLEEIRKELPYEVITAYVGLWTSKLYTANASIELELELETSTQ